MHSTAILLLVYFKRPSNRLTRRLNKLSGRLATQLKAINV